MKLYLFALLAFIVFWQPVSKGIVSCVVEDLQCPK